MPRVAPPLPSRLHGKMAAKIEFLPQVAVDRPERRPPHPAWPCRAVVGAELEFPGPRAPVALESPTRFSVEPPVVGPIERMPPNQHVAREIDPVQGIVANHVLIAQVRTEVVVGEFRLVTPLAVGQGNAETEVGADHVALPLKVQARHSGPFNIKLPAMRAIRLGRSVAQDSYPAAKRHVPQPALTHVMNPLAGKSRFFHAGEIRAVDQPVGEHLPVPNVVQFGRRLRVKASPLHDQIGRFVHRVFKRGKHRTGGRGRAGRRPAEERVGH